MDRTDSRTSKHCDGEFRDHRHIQDDPITFLNPMFFQYIRKTADFSVELLVGVCTTFCGIIRFPDEGGLILSWAVQMPIKTVVGNINFPTQIPLDTRGVEINFSDLVPLFEPMHSFSLLGPKTLRILNRFLIHLLVLFLINQGILKVGRNIVYFCCARLCHNKPPLYKISISKSCTARLPKNLFKDK